MADFAVVLDSDVLFSINSTDLLLTLAQLGLYRPVWTERILRAPVKFVPERREDLSETAIQRRVDAMKRARPDAMVVVPKELEDVMTNHEGDRHVLAAAVHAGASVVVTNNLRHFSPEACERHHVEAQSGDEFVLHLVSLDALAVKRAVRIMSDRRNNPPVGVDEIFQRLKALFPGAMGQLEIECGPPVGWNFEEN